jgi:hypothetical protein
MEKRGSKRGQFYIIAAVIIIAVIIGLFSLTNYMKVETRKTQIYDLGEELGIETGSVYDYGIYNEDDTGKLIENWVRVYYNYTKERGIEDWIFIWGNAGDMEALYFTTKSSGGVSFEFENVNVRVEVFKKYEEKKHFEKVGRVDSLVNVTFHPKNFTHQFKLKKGQNFFFVIRKGEYVAQS